MLEAYNAARRYLKNVEFFRYKPRSSTYKTAYVPNHKVAEIRADELLASIARIDRIAKSANPEWNIQFFTMNQILKEET